MAPCLAIRNVTLAPDFTINSAALKIHQGFPSELERFSNDCRKTKTKAITPTNQDRGKQRDEPITIPSNYM